MSDQEIKDYLKELIINQNDICKAVNKLSRKVKNLSKPSNYDLNNIFGDPVGELDKVFDCCKSQAGDKVVNEPKTDQEIDQLINLANYYDLQRATKNRNEPIKETPLTDLNNEAQLEKQAKELVKGIEQFTNGWSEVLSGCSGNHKAWKFASFVKQIQATKAAIEALNFILENDFSRSELEGIKGVLNGMA